MILVVSFLLFIFTAFFIGITPAFLTLFVELVGGLLSSVLESKYKKEVKQLYFVIFSLGWAYMVACYIYMRYHGYEYLFAFDTINGYIPATERYMEAGKYNYFSILRAVFEDYNIFYRNEYFYLSYSCFWGLMARWLQIDIYYALQLSTLFTYGFVGVVIYKLFMLSGFQNYQARKQTMMICFFSIVFFYSSMILRDTFVLLCYLYAIYLSCKPYFSVTNVVKILLVVFFTFGLRVESGMFLIICLPVYYLSVSKKNSISLVFVVLISAIAIGGFVLSNAFDINNVVEANNAAYMGEKGSGIVGTLHRIPVVGDFIAILYNAVQPVPFWGRMVAPKAASYGAEVYNIMNFPRAFASFFNLIAIVYIIFWMVSKPIKLKVRHLLPKAMRYQAIVGLLFLYLQASVISQRRLMGYYCLFYVLFYIIFSVMSREERKKANYITVSMFVLLQLFAVAFF